VTEKKIESAEVCRESTSLNDKDDDAVTATQTSFTEVTATQTSFTEVTDTLEKATHFSQPQASKDDSEASVSITHKRRI